MNTNDPCSRVSVLLGHHSHAGNLCHSFLVSEIFSLVGGSRSGVDIKIHKGVLYIGRHVRSRERRWDDKHSSLRSTCTDNKPRAKARPVSSQSTHLGLLAAFMSTPVSWLATSHNIWAFLSIQVDADKFGLDGLIVLSYQLCWSTCIISPKSREQFLMGVVFQLQKMNLFV